MKVVELFAGVGGFRYGLESASEKFSTRWFNQWEPSKSPRFQHAWSTYVHRFEADPVVALRAYTNADIRDVLRLENAVPRHDLLVAGFPCQDFSVAKPLRLAKGLEGSKGSLWWSIVDVLSKRSKQPPRHVILENVNRLLKSPAGIPGRDFGVILSCFDRLGYAVEWRVVNAADYGLPQRRKRLFIIAHERETTQYLATRGRLVESLLETGVMARAFPCHAPSRDALMSELRLNRNSFGIDEGHLNQLGQRWFSGGVMCDGAIVTSQVSPVVESQSSLRDVLEHGEVPEEFFISDSEVVAWELLKGAKRITRTSRAGFRYEYAEGAVPFPDCLDLPSRTLVTGEGGKSPSRFKHVVRVPEGMYGEGRLRRLVPTELEALNGFPRDFTRFRWSEHGVVQNSPAQRSFFMGNALVVGLVKRLGQELLSEKSVSQSAVRGPADLPNVVNNGS